MPADNIGLDQIQSALNAAGNPWEAGVTSLSTLPFEEQRKHLGVTPPSGELSTEEAAQQALQTQAKIREEAIGAVTAPAAYDLRDVGGKNFVTDIRDQLSC